MTPGDPPVPQKKKGRTSKAERSNAPLISAPTPATSLGPILPPGPPPGSALTGPSRDVQAYGAKAAADHRTQAAKEGRNLEEALAAAALADEAEEIEGDPSTWAARQRAQNKSWRELGNSLREQYLDSFPTNLARCTWETEILREKLQSELDNFCPAPCECSNSSESVDDCVMPEWVPYPDGQVSYLGLTCTFDLRITTRKCSNCCRNCSPSPVAFGCFPSSPCTPHVWFDLRLLRFFRRQFSEGMSTTGDACMMIYVWKSICSHYWLLLFRLTILLLIRFP